MKLNLESCLFFYSELRANFFLSWREASTILRVLQRPSHKQAQTGSLRGYVTNQGCALMRRKYVFFFIFHYSFEYLDYSESQTIRNFYIVCIIDLVRNQTILLGRRIVNNFTLQYSPPSNLHSTQKYTMVVLRVL